MRASTNIGDVDLSASSTTRTTAHAAIVVATTAEAAGRGAKLGAGVVTAATGTTRPDPGLNLGSDSRS